MQRTPTFEKRSTFETPTFGNWISAKLCKSSTVNSDGLRCYNLLHKRRVLLTILIYLVSKLFCYLTKFSFQPSSSHFEIILDHSPLLFLATTLTYENCRDLWIVIVQALPWTLNNHESRHTEKFCTCSCTRHILNHVSPRRLFHARVICLCGVCLIVIVFRKP